MYVITTIKDRAPRGWIHDFKNVHAVICLLHSEKNSDPFCISIIVIVEGGNPKREKSSNCIYFTKNSTKFNGFLVFLEVL